RDSHCASPVRLFSRAELVFLLPAPRGTQARDRRNTIHGGRERPGAFPGGARIARRKWLSPWNGRRQPFSCRRLQRSHVPGRDRVDSWPGCHLKRGGGGRGGEGNAIGARSSTPVTSF